MYINTYNIINGLVNLLVENKEQIQSVIDAFYGKKSKKILHVYKNIMPTVPMECFPCIEFSPESSTNQWITTEAQYNTYNISCVLTVNVEDNQKASNLIGTLTRKIVEIYTFPNNRCFSIPDEVIWNPVEQQYQQAYVQYGDIQNVSYMASSNGTIRVAKWTWTGKILEGYDYGFYHKHDDNKIPEVPRSEPKNN